MSLTDKIAEIEEEIANTKYNKATQHHIGKLKAKLAELREEVVISSSGPKGSGYGVRKAGGGKYAIRGSIVGILLGIFLFPPFGILVGAFIGAFIGAKMETDRNEIKIAFGAVLGFIAGTILKVCTSVYIIYIILF